MTRKTMTMNQKTIRFLALCATSLALALPAQAFDLGSLKEKAGAVVSGDTAAMDYAALGTQLYDAFKDNPKAMDYAKSMLSALDGEQYQKALSYYDKIKSAKLTPGQVEVWNKVKGQISALILEGNFNYTDSGLAGLVDKAASALRSGDVATVSSQFKALRDSTKLSKDQSALLGSLQKQAALLVSGK